MRTKACLSVLFLLVSTGALAQMKPVTLDVVTQPRPAMAELGAIEWAPDGRRFAYQQGRSIWLYDVAAKSRRELISLSALEGVATPVPEPERFDWQNRRVTEKVFQWSSDGASLLIHAGGDLFLFRIEAGGWNQITATPEAERDPKLSPDGRRVSFRRAHDLYSMEIVSREVTRLTFDGSEEVRNAELDWTYPEELDLGTAHWWSPNSEHIAYLQFDVRRQPFYPHADLLPLRPVYEPQRYPKAGDPNAEVRLGVVPAGGGRTRWMDLGETRGHLLARIDWHPDGKSLLVQRLNRVQNRLELLRADIETGKAQLVLLEEAKYWINIHDHLRFLDNGGQLLWASERDGFRHLYLYSVDGRQLARLTSGDWEVTDVAGVDEPGRQVFFVATERSPLERHLYRVGLDGQGFRRVTQADGTYTVFMGPTCEYYLNSFSSLTAPLRRTIHTKDGAEWDVFTEADRRTKEEFEILPTEIVEVRASDGALLYARLIRPAGFESGKKYPAIVSVYGGPHVQSVRNRWSGADWDQALAHKGFVIWQIDNRGTSGRGHEWEAAVFRNFGAKELEDQKEGLKHLLSMGFVDPERVGITGFSYGGYMTLYALLNEPDLFRAGVAGAPVTDWRNYDTIYTERYMGLPSENEEGFKRSSPVHQASRLKASLLLFHNLQDDNVLFQHTVQMADALQRAGKPFEMMIYAQKTHGITGAARRHMLEMATAFFERILK